MLSDVWSAIRANNAITTSTIDIYLIYDIDTRIPKYIIKEGEGWRCLFQCMYQNKRFTEIIHEGLILYSHTGPRGAKLPNMESGNDFIWILHMSWEGR